MKNSIMKNALGLKVIALMLTVSSCSSHPAKPDESAKADQSRNSEKTIPVVMVKDETVRVSIDHMAFSPDSITIAKGTTIIWTNEQAIIPHTVTSDTKGLFDSGDMHKNDTFSYTFTKAGTYTYHCEHHDKMHGQVIVR